MRRLGDVPRRTGSAGLKGGAEGGSARLAVSLAAAVLMAAASFAMSANVGAEHNFKDQHSPNMSLIASLSTGRGGEVAFWGDMAVLAKNALDGDLKNDGFTLVDISNPVKPRFISTFTCTASSYDVSVWGDLVFLSVDAPVKGTDCGADPVTNAGDGSESFTGIRVISIANPARPKQLKAVGPTNSGDGQAGATGSHTHTLLPDLDHTDAAGKSDPRLLVYSNGRTPNAIIEVPLRNPASARILDEFYTPPNGCHDLSFFLPRKLAACNGIQPGTHLWDITDPVKPRFLSTIVNPVIEHHHSSAFSWDGQVLVFSEENLTNHSTDIAGADDGRCHAGTDSPKGALWFYDISNPSVPVLKSYFQARHKAPKTYCTAHQFNIVPLKSGRDVAVVGWTGAGTTVVDFTDSSDPEEIGYYIADAADSDLRSFPWSSFWYNGYIYANSTFAVLPVPEPLEWNIGSERGFDVMKIEDLGLNDYVRLQHFNFGLQECLRPLAGC